MAQTPRWHFLLRLCECVCVCVCESKTHPVNTLPDPPALYYFPFRSGRSAAPPPALSLWVFSLRCARRVGFPSGYFKGPRGQADPAIRAATGVVHRFNFNLLVALQG